MRDFVRGAFAAIVLGATAVSAQAADLPSYKAPPPPPPVEPFHPFQVRLKFGAVIPTEGTATIYDRGGVGAYYPGFGPGGGLGTTLQFAGYSFGGGTQFYGASTSISNSYQPMLDATYFLTKNWAIEAICCVSNHHVTGVGPIQGASVIKSWVFPPSVMLQYHFTNFGAFQPYLGVGVNFTAFWGTRPGNQTFPFLLPAQPGIGPVALTATSASITPSWGVVGQAGADYMFNDHWGVNLDVKYIMMEPNAHVWAVANVNATGQAYAAPLNLAVKINPIVVSTGLTYRFGGDWGVAPVVAKY
jgi:outer membrane protein